MDRFRHQEHIAARTLDRIDEGFMVLNNKFVVIYMNRAVERLLHCRREDIIGRDIRFLCPRVRNSPLEEICRQALRLQRPVHTEVSVPGDGRRYHLHCDPDGEFLYVRSQDVTAWRLHELTAAAERRWFTLVVGDAPLEELARTIIDELLAVVQFGGASILGVGRDHLEPVANSDRLAPLYGDPEFLRLDSVRCPAAMAAYEARPVTLLDVERETRWTAFRKVAHAAGFRSCCVQPVIGPQGGVTGLVVLCLDYPIADPTPYLGVAGAAARIWSAALQRRSRANYLRLLNAADHRMFMMGSHELRNGLAAIQSALDLLAHRSERAEVLAAGDVMRVTDRARRSLGHLMNLFESTLHSAAATAGDDGDATAPAATDLSEVVAATVHQYQTASDSHEIRVTRSPEPVLGRWDALRLRHVLGNLLSNALKYSPPGSTIDVALGVESGQAVLTVRDEGIGIPPDDLTKIFALYHRGNNVGDRPGTGVGLTLVREVVEDYRGSVEVAPNRPRGTIVTVRLPLD